MDLPDNTIITLEIGALFLLNLLSTVFLSRKISRISIEKKLERIEQQQQHFDENEIHTVLNNRLLDIQNRKYSIQGRFRGKNGS